MEGINALSEVVVIWGHICFDLATCMSSGDQRGSLYPTPLPALRLWPCTEVKAQKNAIILRHHLVMGYILREVSCCFVICKHPNVHSHKPRWSSLLRTGALWHSLLFLDCKLRLEISYVCRHRKSIVKI